MSDTHVLVLLVQDIVFTSIFCLDIVLKTIALGPISYLSSRWNQFDVVIIAAGLLSLFFTEVAFAKMMRVLRVFRLVKTSLHFRMLISTVLSSMGTIAEIIALMTAILLSYAFIGMCTFDKVKYGNAINSYQNFDDFPNAFYSLVVVTFGDWVVLLKDLEIASPACTVGQDCGNPAAGVYLMSFILLTNFVLMNLVVAAILNSFSWLSAMENSRGNSAVGVADLRKFKAVWQTFDVYSTGSVSHLHLKALIETVGEPIGRKDVSTMWFRALQAEISNLPGFSSGEISFRDLFVILTTTMMGADALCESLDGEVITSDQQLTKLAAVQAVVSNAHWETVRCNVTEALPPNRVNRRMSLLSLGEQIQRAKDAADAAAASNQTLNANGNTRGFAQTLNANPIGADVQSRESLSLKDKVLVHAPALSQSA
jgi:hypothetical protein